MPNDDFRLIPLAEIVKPWVILRVVNRGSVEYLELRDSLAAVGFLNSICVRPSKRTRGKVEVVDGLYRYTAACELKRSYVSRHPVTRRGIPCLTTTLRFL